MAESGSGVIVVIDGKHQGHDWAADAVVRDGALFLYETSADAPGVRALLVYRDWEFFYWGASLDDMPGRTESLRPFPALDAEDDGS